MKQTRSLFFVLFLFLGNWVLYGQCTVNAGGNTTICGTSYTLQGTTTGTPTGTPTWTIVSKPPGAPDPVFSNPNILTPNVTGMTFPGNYVFQVAQNCNSGSATNQVTITAPGEVSAFTAGPDITNVNATVGTVTLNGVVPAGYTAQWSAYNLWRYERSLGTITSQNSTFGSPTSATTTFSLINKANHDIDPSYVVTLRITSINNPSCYYEDTAIVRFIPNPQIIVATSKNECTTTGNSIIGFSSGSPIFGTTTAGAAGSPGNGTTVTMNVISQPSGGNIAYTGIIDNFNFSGASVPGVYKFTITVTNSSGTYTTPEITYTNQGAPAGYVSFLVPSEPEQMMIYDASNSGGRVHCGMVGSIAPISFSYTINPADPVTVTSSVSSAGVPPPGGNPSNITTTGSGTATTRTTTVTPPSGGWRAGTYRFLVSTGNGTCPAVSQSYYIHISDGARPNVSVNNITVCYPGSGSVTANVQLPAIYKGAVNSSYFQDFDGAYDFTLVSSPSGAATPVYQARNLRRFTFTSTTISNLTTPGEYVFKIKPGTYIPSVGAFLDKEYACSETSMEGTFSIFVSAQVGANAGSAQTLTTTQTTLNGNNPGVASGMWTLVSKPSGATDPVIASPSLYNSNVTGLNYSGTYTFRWTVTTGTCVSTSDVNVNVTINNCVNGCNPNTFVNSSDPNTIEYDNMVSAFHSTIVKESDGSFKVWGENTHPNGTGNLYTPTVVTPANGFNYTGTPLKATASSYIPNTTAYHQHVLLTTDGLYVWGMTNTLISSIIKGTTAFGKITVNGKADGLPPGVMPQQVKMMFGAYGTFAIVTCSGEAWVLSFDGNKNGDGTAQDATNNVIWHRVKTSAAGNPTLDNVVAMRGTNNALFALTSDSKLYTWGTGTYINSGAAANRTYATEISVPVGITPKMIGMTQYSTYTVSAESYYLLATDGRLYSMGDNTHKQLGDGTTITRTSWVQPQKMTDQYGQGTGPLENVVWISPNEHQGNSFTAAINVLTSDRKLWAWGRNESSMIGGSIIQYDPTYMPGSSTAADGMKITDKIIAVETGGHTSMNIKEGSDKFGYVGHYVNGSAGNGSTNDWAYENYTYNTGVVSVCAAETGPAVQDLTICNGTTANLNNANLATIPGEVEWHATNSASSPVMTNITAVAVGTYYAFYTVASGKQRIAGSAATVAGVVCCSTGDCNPNTFVKSSDPNTIEYDNMVSMFHSTIIKESGGIFKAWGQKTASNGTGNLLVPTAITAANSFNYTGTPLRATGGSDGTATSAPAQFALLTTDGLYVWGTANTLISSTIKNTTDFGKITVNGKTDGLPPGVIPGQVKMMFGSYGTLAITTCNGEAWVLSFNGSKNGDGTAQDATNNVIWYRVKTVAAGNPNLDNVVAIRGTKSALFALTSNGELYTWGTNTYINSGAAASRTYATQVTVPGGVTPKMIGMTSQALLHSYYLLATDGKLYAMGDNSRRQLGDGTATTSMIWVQPKKMTNQSGQGTGVLENIAWISPNEHDSSPSGEGANINVLTNNNKQWAWGYNSGYMFGGATTNTSYDPIYMPGNSTATDGLKVTDVIIAVETGGHTSMNIKKGAPMFGYVGHRVDGSMGNGDPSNAAVSNYTYNTAIVTICGAENSPAVQDLTICNGTTANLNNANLEATPSQVEWHATNDASSPVMTNITAVNAGTYYAFYTVASGKQRIVGSAATVTGVVCCSTGDCNPNTFVNAVDPNTIEYDNMVGLYHAMIVKEGDSAFKVWGEYSAPTGTSHFLSPTSVTSANGFNYTGTPLKATGGTYFITPSPNVGTQYALLTTDGLYVWGTTNTLISSSIKSTTAFSKITVNGKADGLPPGVIPAQVKMMFGAYGTLAITTCSGEAWVLSMNGDKNGDGTAQDAANNVIWHRVKTSATTDLNNVVAMRGTAIALFALTSDAKLYTWGTNTYVNDVSGATNRMYATEISALAGITPKMIGMSQDSGTTMPSYYLLATNGKVYCMGANNQRQLGDGTTTTRTTWVQPQKVTDQSGQGIGPLENIAWIAPNEHQGAPSVANINVLTNDYKLWDWGGSSAAFGNTEYMPRSSSAANGMKITDEIIAVEPGGDFEINFKKGSDKFGFNGHVFRGNSGEGTSVESSYPTYVYNTILTLCGAPTSSLCYKPGITAGTALDTKVGITSLSRAGVNADNWPMTRKGGWLALESKTKGFVPNKVAFSGGNPVGIAPANFVEGMIVYDDTNKCMKMYTQKEGDPSMAWHCITTQACPD